MSIAAYLPSAQFAVMAGSIVVAGGLVVGAQYITHQPQTTLEAAQTGNPAEDWKAALDEIQANAGISLPEVPAQETVNAILESTKSNNLTDSLARSLFVSLTDAKARGLGDDIPTQDELVAEALAEAETPRATTYTQADLETVAQSPTTLRLYGNAVMQIFAAHPRANAAEVITAVGSATDYNESARLAPLKDAEAAYASLAQTLAGTAVPQTLSPLHLQIVNNFAVMAQAVGDMRDIGADPVRGLSGVQRFYALGNETLRVLTTMAGTFSKNGILFSKDEPGSAWSAFISLQQ